MGHIHKENKNKTSEYYSEYSSRFQNVVWQLGECIKAEGEVWISPMWIHDTQFYPTLQKYHKSDGKVAAILIMTCDIPETRDGW